MAGWAPHNKKRNVIPRWRDLNQTIALGELKPIGTLDTSFGENLTSDFHVKKIVDWKTEKSVKNALELLNSSFVLDDLKYSTEIQDFMSKNNQVMRKPVRLLFEKIDHPTELNTSLNDLESLTDIDNIIRTKIHNLRSRLVQNPGNAISWIELARLYLIIGKENAAERCILVGTQLSPHNRYVSRVASRFFTHTGDFAKAKQILKANQAFRIDPWLLGADIGISSLQNKSSFYIKAAKELVASKNYSAFDLNELLSALATVELYNGSAKNSRKLFNQSLIKPNDNTLAQVVWATKHIILDVNESTFDRVPNIHEAHTYRFYHLKQWEKAMQNTLNWFIDQPFSIDPASFGSFIACSVLERYDEAIKLCNIGLNATPNNFTLMNNLAYSLLQRGQPDDIKSAKVILSKIQVDALENEQKIVFFATKGLLMYKLCMTEQGAELYAESSRIAGKIKNKKLKLLSEFHHFAIQCEIEGFPEEKFIRIEKFKEELNKVGEVYLIDLIKNLIQKKQKYESYY